MHILRYKTDALILGDGEINQQCQRFQYSYITEFTAWGSEEVSARTPMSQCISILTEILRTNSTNSGSSTLNKQIFYAYLMYPRQRMKAKDGQRNGHAWNAIVHVLHGKYVMGNV